MLNLLDRVDLAYICPQNLDVIVIFGYSFPSEDNESSASHKGGHKMFKRLWKDEDGLTTPEYALILALAAILATTAWTTLGSKPLVTNATTPGR